MRLRPSLAGLVSLVAGGLLLAGCGEGDGTSSKQTEQTRAELSAVAQRLRPVRTYRFALRLRTDIDHEKLTADVRGVTAADGDRGRFEGKVSQGGQTLGVTVVTRGTTGFMRVPELKLLFPRGRSWLRIGDDDAPIRTLTPAQVVSFMLERGEAENAGRERVRSQLTTHYRSAVDIKQLVTRSGAASGSLRRLLLDGKLPADITIDVWVEDGGLPLRTAMTATPKDHRFEGSLKLVSDILGYDAPLNAKTPPSRLVAEQSELG